MAVRILLAGLIAGLVSNLTGYLIVGRWFHSYQARTPATWRSHESWNHYLYSTAIRVVACIGLAALYAHFGAVMIEIPGSPLTSAAAFALCLWAVTVLPLVVEAALFVNWHPGFVAGLLLDWLVICLVACVIAGFAMRGG